MLAGVTKNLQVMVSQRQMVAFKGLLCHSRIDTEALEAFQWNSDGVIGIEGLGAPLLTPPPPRSGIPWSSGSLIHPGNSEYSHSARSHSAEYLLAGYLCSGFQCSLIHLHVLSFKVSNFALNKQA